MNLDSLSSKCGVTKGLEERNTWLRDVWGKTKVILSQHIERWEEKHLGGGGFECNLVRHILCFFLILKKMYLFIFGCIGS